MGEKREQRKRGRPTIYVMPERIPETPENIARAAQKELAIHETGLRR